MISAIQYNTKSQIILSLLYSLDETKPDWRWQLTASGRFAHRKEYVANMGLSHDLTLIHYENLDGFRHEHGKDVRGHIFVMKKGIEENNNKDDEL